MKQQSISLTIRLFIVALFATLLTPEFVNAGVANGEYDLTTASVTAPGSSNRFTKIAEDIYFHRVNQNVSSDGIKMKQSLDQQSGIVFRIDESTNISVRIKSSNTKKDDNAQIIAYRITDDEYNLFAGPDAVENSTKIDRSSLDLSTEYGTTMEFKAGRTEKEAYSEQIPLDAGCYYLIAIEEYQSGELFLNSLVINDKSCGPTLTIGGVAGWAGGKTYNVDDTPTLTFTLEAKASDDSHTLHYAWYQYKNGNPATAEKADESTDSPSYTPPTSKAHTGYIYYCVVTEIGCGQTVQTAYTGTVTVNNRAIADYTGGIGTFTPAGNATADGSGVMSFPNNYQNDGGYHYFEITPKDNMGFCPYDTIVYYDYAKNADVDHLIIYDGNNNLIFENSDVSAQTEYTKHTLVLTTDMLASKVEKLRIGRIGTTGYYISQFRVYPYEKRDEQVSDDPTFSISLKPDIANGLTSISIVPSDANEVYFFDTVESSTVSGKTVQQIAEILALKHVEDGDISDHIMTGNKTFSLEFCHKACGSSYTICAAYIDILNEVIKYPASTAGEVYTIPTYEQKAEYEITFRENTAKYCEDSNTKGTSIDELVFSGADLLSDIEVNNFVYPGQMGNGMKIGKNDNVGTITLKLATPTALSKIEVYAVQYSAKENALAVYYNGNDGNTTTLTLSEDLEKYTIDCNDETISEITFASTKSKKRCYIAGLNFIKAGESEYDIVFKDDPENPKDASTALTSTEVSDYVTVGADLIESINSSTNIFTGGTGNGLKMGTGSNSGVLRFTLKKPVKATSIEILARGYTHTQNVIKVNKNDVTLSLTDDLYKIDLDGSEISKITIQSEKQSYILAMNINGTVVEPEPCTPQNTTLTETICEGESYTLGDKTFSDNGTYNVTVKDDNGCDINYTLNLTVNKATSETITQTAVGSYTYAGQTYTESGTYTFTTKNDAGCDHVVTLILTIEDLCKPQEKTLTETICEGEVYTIDSYSFNKTGVYSDIVVKDENGCDINYTLNLTVNKATSETITETAVGSYTYNGQTYTESGTYTIKTKNDAGCDHTITLNLTISKEPEPCKDKTETLDITICEGESYELGTQTLTTGGTYTETMKTHDGCDSTVTVNLTVNKPTAETIERTEKASFTWFGKVLTETGTYTNTITNKAGCDSVITLNLTIIPAYTPCTDKEVTLNETICEGEKVSIGNNTYSKEGQYKIILKTKEGCDSTVTLNLTVNKPTSETITHTAVNSYTWFDQTLTQSGRYTHKTTNVTGCDSTIILLLTIEKEEVPCTPKEVTINASICEGESYQLGNTTFKQAGTYTIPFDCDSIVTLNLTVNKATTSTTTHTAVGSYTWNGRVLTESGTYYEKLVNSKGCDSTAMLRLIIEDAPQPCETTYESQTITICEGETYQFYGQSISEEGAYTQTTTTADGCEKIITLTVKVATKSYTTVSETAVKFYTWFGKLYTQSGQYTTRLVNQYGCDSIITLNLTIKDEEEVITPCEPISYTAVSNDASMGSVIVIQEPTCDNQNTLAVSAEANTGYHFTQWSDGSKETLRILTLTEPVSLTAYFEADEVVCTPFTILALNSNKDAGSVTILQEPTCDNGNQAVIEAVSYDEKKYTFSHWSDGDKEAHRTLTLTRHTVLTANWTKVQSADTTVIDTTSCTPYRLTINYSDKNAGTVTIIQRPACNNNNTAIVSVTSNTGYTFAGWENGSIDNPRTITLTADMTITATWIENCRPYSLTLLTESDEQGRVTISQEPSCDNQNTAIFEATPTEHYTFTQWSDGSVENPRTLTLVSDLTLYAKFNLRQYRIYATPDDSEHGTVSGSGTYLYNSTAKLVAVGKPGYEFTQWSDGVTANPREITVTQDLNLQAYFTESYFTINVRALSDTMGTVSGSGRYQAYTMATISAEPFEGYVFKCWTDGNTQAVRNVLVYEDATYVAVFARLTEGGIQIEALSANEGMGEVSGSGYYAAGTSVTLTATPKPGYEFVRWNDDVTDNPRTIIALYDMTYRAYFWFSTGLEENTLQGLSFSDMELHIDGHEGETINIYSVTGQTVFSGKVEPVISLPYHGVFIIRIADAVAKIAL